MIRIKQTVWVLGLALIFIVLTLYSMTLSRQYSGDDLQKAAMVENVSSEIPLWHPVSLDPGMENGPAEAVHPRYLLEVEAAVQLTRLFRELGLADRTLLPMQILHLLLGTLGVMGLYTGLLRLTSPAMAFILSLFLATSYGWWYYSTHPDFVLAGSVFLTIVLGFLINLLAISERRTVIWLSIGLGISMALAILFFLTSALFIPVLIFAIWLRFWHDLREPRSGLFSLSAAGLAMLATGAVLSGVILVLNNQGQLSLLGLTRSALYLDGPSKTLYDVGLGDIARAFFGISKSFVKYPLLGNLTPGDYFSQVSTFEGLLMLAWSGVQVALFALPFGLLLWRWKSLGQYRITTVVLITWIVAQLPFGILWVPVEVKWWLTILPAWIMLVAVTTTVSLDSELGKRIGFMGILLYVTVALIVNMSTAFWPQAQVDPQGPQEAARIMATYSSPDDLFISSSGSDLDFYLPYFEKRRVISYPLATMFYGDEAYVQERLRVLVEAYGERYARIFVYDCSSEQSAVLLAVLDIASAVQQQVVPPVELSDLGSICQISIR